MNTLKGHSPQEEMEEPSPLFRGTGKRVRTNTIRPTELPPFEIDLVREDELNFVLSSWMRSYRKESLQEAPFETDGVYYDGMQKLIAAYASEAKVIVARDVAGGERSLMGWMCYRPKRPGERYVVVHYVYIKDQMRFKGLATSLLSQTGWEPGDIILSGFRWKVGPEVREQWNFKHNRTLRWKGC